MLKADELPYIDLDDAAAGLCDRGDISNEQHRRLMAAAAPLYMQFVDKVRRAVLSGEWRATRLPRQPSGYDLLCPSGVTARVNRRAHLALQI